MNITNSNPMPFTLIKAGAGASSHRNYRAPPGNGGALLTTILKRKGERKKNNNNTILQKTLKRGNRVGNRRGKTLYHWFTITGLANISHSEEGAGPFPVLPLARLDTGGPRQEPSTRCLQRTA